MTTPDPLAEWIDHLPGVTSAFGVTFGELMVPVSAVRQHFRAALAQPEPLDVERLAQALHLGIRGKHYAEHLPDDLVTLCDDGTAHYKQAEAIAAAYASLSRDTETPGGPRE